MVTRLLHALRLYRIARLFRPTAQGQTQRPAAEVSRPHDPHHRSPPRTSLQSPLSSPDSLPDGVKSPSLAHLGTLVAGMVRAGENLMASTYHLHASVLRQEQSPALDRIFRDVRQAFRNLFGEASNLFETMDRIGRNVNFFVDHVRREETAEDDRREYIEGISEEIAQLPGMAEAVVAIFESSRDSYSQKRGAILRVFTRATTGIRLLASAKPSNAAYARSSSGLSVDVTYAVSSEEERVWTALREYGHYVIALEQMLRGQSLFLERWRSQLPSMVELDQLDRLWQQASHGGLADAMADFARLQDALVPAQPPAPDTPRSAKARPAWPAALRGRP